MDSLRKQSVGTYGSRRPLTPALDRLAQDSIVFDHAYTTAPWTLPSMATVMTGQHPGSLGIIEEDNAVNESLVTLPELFKKAGYETAAIVSHVYMFPKYGVVQGFDHLDKSEVKGHSYISSPGITDRALEDLEGHKGKPVFMLLHYFDPHYYYIMHEGMNGFPDYHGPVVSDMPIQRLRDMALQLNDTDARYLNALYDSEVQYTDQHLGRFLDTLKKEGLYDNSLIVLMGDHGEELGDRLPDRWIGHSINLHEDLVNVPLMIKLPGNRIKRRESRTISTVDLMPTIAALAGLPALRDARPYGKALNLDDLSGSRRFVFTETGKINRLRAVYDGKWKLLKDEKTKKFYLYDVQADPGESKDVASEHTAKVEELTRALDTVVAEIQGVNKVLAPSRGAPELSPEEDGALRAMGYLH